MHHQKHISVLAIHVSISNLQASPKSFPNFRCCHINSHKSFYKKSFTISEIFVILSAICVLHGLEQDEQIFSGKDSVWTSDYMGSDISTYSHELLLLTKKKKKRLPKALIFGNNLQFLLMRKIFGQLFDMYALFLHNYHVYPQS